MGKKFFLNKVLAILDKRRQAADEQITAAQTARGEALALKETYEENLKQAKDQAGEILAHAHKTAAARSEEIIGQAQAQAAHIREKASADIAREKKHALNQAKDEVSHMAIAIAEKVVERQLNEADQDKLVSRFIDSLGDAL